MQDRRSDDGLFREAALSTPSTRGQLAAEMAAAASSVSGDNPGRRSPIICAEFSTFEIELSAIDAFVTDLPGAPAGATRMTIERALLAPARRPDGTSPSTCIVELDHIGSKRVFLDLAAAGVTALTGSDTAVDDALVNLATQADASRVGVTTQVIVVGRDLRGLAEASTMIPVNRIEESLEVLRRLESSHRVGEAAQATLVVIGREAFRGLAIQGLLAYSESRPWCSVLLPSAAVATRVMITAVGGSMECFLRATRTTTTSRSDALPEATIGVDPPVEIAVLGQIEVRGAPGSLDKRPKLTELIVYLAMHPEGATTATWQNALWPDRRVPPQTVANRLSEARRLLGMELDGTPRLRKSAERHRLTGVTTDWERFLVLADVHNDHLSWRQALELVRGRPFDDLQEGQWTVFEGFCGEIETAIMECALRYGEDRMTAGDPDAVAWAAQRALRANPYDERLHRLLMRAADAAGNRSGVDAVYRALLLVIDIEGDGTSSVHPETAALYEELSGRRGAAVA